MCGQRRREGKRFSSLNSQTIFGSHFVKGLEDGLAAICELLGGIRGSANTNQIADRSHVCHL